MSNRIILQQVDIVDVVEFLSRKNRQYQATLLSNLEQIYDPSDKRFKEARKLVLDSTNNFHRLVVRTIFGDIENG